MNIYLRGEDAFVDLGNGYLLCIGKKSDVDNADGNRIMEMVREAIAWSNFRELSSSRHMTLH